MAGMRDWARRLGGAAALLAALAAFQSCDIEGLRARIAAQVVAAKTPGTVETPVFTPAGGSYNTNQTVTITCATEGADIYFTLDGDGSTPTTYSGTKYTAPIQLAADSTTTTVSALAVRNGMTDSAIATASYTIDYTLISTPQFSVAPGFYAADQSVTITCDPSSATIYYTADGSDPTTSSTVYAGPVSVAGDGTITTLKAFAAGDQLKTSGTASATYQIFYQPAQWVRTAVSATRNTYFYAAAVDASTGDIYAAGVVIGGDTVTFDTGVTATGVFSTGNALLVKYNSNGVAQWARAPIAAPDESHFESVAVDSSGNIYAVGYANWQGQTYTFPSSPSNVSVTIGGGTFQYNNVLIVKFKPNGDAIWAKSVDTGPNYSYSYFKSVAAYASDNVYAAGYIYGKNPYTIGGQTAQGAYTSYNLVLVKYDSSGNVTWIRNVSGITMGASEYLSVAVDSSENIYAAGYAGGTNGDFGTNTLGTLTGQLLVKYDKDGNDLWARTLTAGSTGSKFTSLALDNSVPPNIYAAGYLSGTSLHDFGNGKTATGTDGTSNIVLVKYESALGNAQWARTVSTGPSASQFNSVAFDAASGGSVYAAGYITGTSQFDFGNNKKAAGVISTYSSVLLVKYDTSGITQWAQTVFSGSVSSEFKSVAAYSGHAFVAGLIGDSAYDFGGGKTVTGANFYSVVLVKY